MQHAAESNEIYARRKTDKSNPIHGTGYGCNVDIPAIVNNKLEIMDVCCL